MANCKKDTPNTVLNGGALSKTIKFSTDRKQVRFLEITNLSEICTNNIDSSQFLGVKIVNNELVFTDAISGLTHDASSNISNNPSIALAMIGGGATVGIIGVDDLDLGFSAPQVNVRYDTTTNSIKFQY